MASIRARGDSWRVEWRLGGTRMGERQSLTATSLAAAKDVQRQVERAAHAIRSDDLRRAAIVEQANGSPQAVLTVAEWVQRHVASLAPVLMAGTLHEYETTMRVHLEPSKLGRTPLADVAREDVQAWVGEIVRKGRAPKTVSNNYVLVATAMRAAVDQRVITHNPCRGVTLPRADSHTHDVAHYLTRQQVDIIARHAGRYEPLVVLLARTGLRWGEATALQVGDIDLLAKPPALRVQRAWNKATTAGGRHLGPPKTTRSRRTVTLDAATLDAVMPLLVDRSPGEWVFTAPDGVKPLPAMTFRRHWTAAIKALGVSVRIHDLRHTHASWLIQAGVPLPVIQRRLGHESITTTIDRYGHLAPDADVAVMAALNSGNPAG